MSPRPSRRSCAPARAVAARGYVQKGTSWLAIVAAVRAVAAGHVVVSPDVLPATAATAAGRAAGAEALTPRESQVLALLSEGRSNEKIADALHIGVKGVEFHLTHLYEKLGVRSRAEAIVKVRQSSRV